MKTGEQLRGDIRICVVGWEVKFEVIAIYVWNMFQLILVAFVAL